MQNRNGKKTIDMTEGPVWKQLVMFTIPLIVGELLQQCYTTADSIIVGRWVGKQALAAVTGTESVINIIIGIFTGLSMGTTIVLSQIFGSKNRDDLHEAIQTTITVAVLGGVGFTLLGIVAVPLLLNLLSTPVDVYADAHRYLMIYFGGMTGLIVYNMCSSVFRAVGNTRLPLKALAITSVCNILLDLLFVVGFRWGVSGAALATVGSQIASAAYLLHELAVSDEAYHVDLKKPGFNSGLFLRIVRVGIPISIQKSLVATSNTLVISHINLFGSGAMAAWGIYRKIDRLVLNAAQNLSVAVSTFVGQNHGARNEKRIREGCRAGYILGLGISGTLIISVLLLRRPLIGLFNGDPEVLAYGSRIMMYLMPFQMISTINQIQSGTIRGYGNSRGPMLITLISHILLRQMYLLLFWNGNPVLETALNCYPIGWICALVMLAVYGKTQQRRRDAEATRCA